MAIRKKAKYGQMPRRVEDAPDWLVHELMTTRTQRAAELIAAHMLRGEKIPYQTIANLWRPDKEPRYAKMHFLQLKRQPLMQQLITSKIREAMLANQINEDEVIKQYKTALQLALANERPDHAMQITDRFARMLGMDQPQAQAIEMHGGQIVDADYIDVIETYEQEHQRRLAAREEDQSVEGGEQEPDLLGADRKPPVDEGQVS
jgi:hypothetical protein